jgi:peroxiredoxin
MERAMPQLLAPETAAPDFTLRVTPDQYLSLSELRGRRVILSFYPADWSPVCGDQITLYNQVREEFHKYDAEILGISVDTLGVIKHTQSITTSTFHFSPIFIRKARLRRSTVLIANKTEYASAPCL